MPGIKAYRKLQMGKETTAGTAVPATSIWRGIGTIQDNLETVFPQEDIAILPGTDRAYIPRVEALLSLENTEATFEQLPYIFEMGIESVVPTTDANGEIYTYTMPIASTDINTSTDLGTYTWEGGDNQQAEEFAYGFVRSFNLSGDAGQALMMNAEVVGRQVAPTTDNTFTGGLSIPTVEEILFSKGKLFIDAVSTYPATTQKSNTLLAMNLACNTGWTPVYTADGALYFSFVKQAQPEITMSITFEHDAVAVAEIAAWRAGTPRSIALEFDGSSDAKYLKLRLVGKWDNFEKIGERDGNDIVTGNFRARYNATAAAFFTAIVGNTLESLP
jgi:hypothetical protein